MGSFRPFTILAAILAVAAGCNDTPEPVVLAAETVPPTVAQTAPVQPQLDYPDLVRSRYYTVSASTPLQSALPSESKGSPSVENLPPQGIFQVIDRRLSDDELWYHVRVSNGAHDYAMYLNAAKLNGQDVQPYQPPAQPPMVQDTPPPRTLSMPRVRLF